MEGQQGQPHSTSGIRSEQPPRVDVDPSQPTHIHDAEEEQSRVDKYMQASIAPSTAQGYGQVYRKWERYCDSHQVPCVPATVERVSKFIAQLADETNSWAQVKKGAAAIAKAHDEAFAARPTEVHSFKRLMQGIKRQLDKPNTRTPRVPFTKGLIQRAISKFLQPSAKGVPASLADWRTVWRMCVEFYALARWDDIIQLEAKDISFHSSTEGEYMRIHFSRSKTDQLGRGTSAVIKAQNNSPFCPLRITRTYLQLLGYDQNQKTKCQPMQPRVRRIRERQVPQVQRVSYTTALQDLRRILTGLGEDAAKYGEHSGRRGGATAAASGGASIASIQTGGRWASATSASLYVDRSLEEQLEFAAYLQK